MSGPDRFYLYHGRRLAVNGQRGSEIWDYTEEPRGLSGLMDAELPLKRGEPRRILRGVIHKGGTSPQQTVDILVGGATPRPAPLPRTESITRPNTA